MKGCCYCCVFVVEDFLETIVDNSSTFKLVASATAESHTKFLPEWHQFHA